MKDRLFGRTWPISGGWDVDCITSEMGRSLRKGWRGLEAVGALNTGRVWWKMGYNSWSLQKVRGQSKRAYKWQFSGTAMSTHLANIGRSSRETMSLKETIWEDYVLCINGLVNFGCLHRRITILLIATEKKKKTS